MTKKTSKNLFIFQTGHGKGLAKAEILSLLPGSIVDEVNDGFVVETDALQGDALQGDNSLQQNATAFLSKMGGIVRITEVIQSGPARMPLNFEEWVVKAISEVAEDPANKDRKIRFGLSMHPKSEKILKKTLIGTKKNVQKSAKEGKSSGGTAFNVRFVNKDFQNLSSVQAWHQKLLKGNSVELHLFKSDDNSPNPKWYLTRTLAIQNFEAYSLRDYDRPARSAKNGMFPPKLAQILINLAGPTPQTTIYDPFCGSGTVMQEALLMGYKTQGSDLSEAMVSDSKENLAWLAENFQPGVFVPGQKSNLKADVKIFAADATQLTKADLPDGDFVIVTETWLGPILEKTLSPLELPKVQREIEALYEALFSNLQKVAPGVTVVFTAPYHRDKTDRHFLPNLPAILKKYCQITPLSDHGRPSLFYERKDQLVSREIWKVVINKK